jgi:hypothetical protein
LGVYDLNIPATLRAGDTIEWDESIPDYPATDGWTLAFQLYAYGKTPITITASADGAGYSISVAPSTTRNWVAGLYSWQAYVYNMAGSSAIVEKHTLYSGSVIILPDLTQSSSTTDNRSIIKRTLDNIEAVLENRASTDVLSYTISSGSGSRSLSKMSKEELVKNWIFFRGEYQRELDAEAIRRGEDSPRRVGIRFRRP